MKERTITNDYFAMMPQWILFSGISDGAVRLYAVLCTYADSKTLQCWPSRAALAADMNKKRAHTIDPYLKELEELGAIRITRRKKKDSLENTSHLYTLLPDNPHAIEPEPDPVEVVPNSVPRGTENRPVTKNHLTITNSSIAIENEFSTDEPLSPSQNEFATPTQSMLNSNDHSLHAQLRTTKAEAQTLIDQTLNFYTTGSDIASPEYEALEKAIEELTGEYVGDAVANKRWDDRLAEIIQEEAGRPRYAATKWLGSLINWTRAAS